MPRLTTAEVEAFLDEPGHLVRIGTVDADGMPRVVHPPGEDDAWRETYRTIARRYVAPDAADAYLAFTIEEPRALIAVSRSVSRTSTWRMPVGDEDPTGIWAARYFHR